MIARMFLGLQRSNFPGILILIDYSLRFSLRLKACCIAELITESNSCYVPDEGRFGSQLLKAN